MQAGSAIICLNSSSYFTLSFNKAHVHAFSGAVAVTEVTSDGFLGWGLWSLRALNRGLSVPAIQSTGTIIPVHYSL